ncbi:DUF2842 domain-containing protein [Polymorphobacter sp. PAMC 29334]|uniref:DUF2842 domain-containing protein n=1 Tax=Polymorphobacter sp. PAMC 29334 TaxID=2862331 RepID=UPI00351D4148
MAQLYPVTHEADNFTPCAYVGGMAMKPPTYRKPIGVLAMVLGLIIYAGLVSRLLGPIGALPWYIATPVYLLLGCLWLLPLKPLLQWMETGSWRAPR